MTNFLFQLLFDNIIFFLRCYTFTNVYYVSDDSVTVMLMILYNYYNINVLLYRILKLFDRK